MNSRQRPAVPRGVTDGDAGSFNAVPFLIDFSAQRAVVQVETFRTALTELGGADSERRAVLLAMFAVAQSHTAESDGAEATLSKADAIAARLGSPAAQAYTLLARCAIDLSPESLPARAAAIRDVLALLAGEAGAALQHLLPLAYLIHLGALMESGDIRALDEALSAEIHTVGQFAGVVNGRYAVWFRCARASMDGQLALAERLADKGHGLASAAGDVDADAVWAGQVAIIRWMQGRVSEMEPVFLRARQADPAEAVWAAAVAWIWAHQGRAQAARGLIDSLPDVSTIPRSRNWLAAVAILAEVASEVGSDDSVEQLRQALLPFADRVVTLGLGVASWGTAARPLALLAVRQGKTQEALDYFRVAIDLSGRIGAQAWLAQAQVELAALLWRQGDGPSARRLAMESAAAASNLGLRAVEQRADGLLGRLDSDGPDAASVSAPEDGFTSAPAASTHAATSRATRQTAAHDGLAGLMVSAAAGSLARPRITVLGDFWVVSADGVVATWKSRKARTLLKILLARRGSALARESAMDMIWPDIDPHTLRNRFSVALTTVRRALDPNRRHEPDEFLIADANVLRLRMDRLSVDVEDFFSLAKRARTAPVGPTEPDAHRLQLRAAMDAYTGDAFSHEPYAAWAEQLRRQAHLAIFGVSHELADLAADQGDHLQRVDLFRRILAADPYDQRAYDGLIDALSTLGATTHVTSAKEERHRRMAELGLTDS